MVEERNKRGANIATTDVNALIKRYRAAADRVRRLAGAGKTFKAGYVFLLGAIIAYVVVSRFGRFPIWPAAAAVVLVVGFWLGHKLYKKEQGRAAADALELEANLRANAERRPAAERDEILRAADVPITDDELNRLRPSDFEKRR